MTRGIIVRRMRAWHDGPNGGTCPRTDGPQCSVRGAELVTRYGAVVGLLLAARYVSLCSISDDGIPCGPSDGRDARPTNHWTSMGDESFRAPCDVSMSTFRVLFLFARIGLFGTAPPGRQCGRDDPHGGSNRR